MRALAGVTFGFASLLIVAAGASGQSAGKPEHRIIPIHPMSEDVEILYGDPETPGEPFVIRIRELAGGIIPPHKHPVDENITVVQGTLYFTGRIRQGYDSGEMIGYEIDGDDGTLFAAEERDLSPAKKQ